MDPESCPAEQTLEVNLLCLHEREKERRRTREESWFLFSPSPCLHISVYLSKARREGDGVEELKELGLKTDATCTCSVLATIRRGFGAFWPGINNTEIPGSQI